MSAPVALVTAGGAGIGAAIATQFADAGYIVHIADVDSAASAALTATRPSIDASRADVSSAADVDRLFDALAGRYGRLDVLVNNAGIAGPTAPVEAVTPDEWDRTVAVDLSGAFYCARHAVPMLKAAGQGSIVNIASSAVFSGYPLRAPYAASKWGLIGLTKTLAMELGPHGIRVNAICPGSVAGDRIDAVIERDAAARGRSADEVRGIYERQVSMRRFASAGDIAALAVFLASAAGAMISGQVIGVDGHTESLSNWLD